MFSSYSMSLSSSNEILRSMLKVSKYAVFSGPNTGKYVSEETPYLDTFHAVATLLKESCTA